jgi:hypothetical protein
MLCCALLVATTTLPLLAAGYSREFDIKAAIVYNFLKFVDWPAAKNDLVIGILGKDPLSPALMGMSGRTIGPKKVAVREVSNPAQADFVFVAESKASDLKGLVNSLKSKPCISVSDIPNFCEAGGCLGLYRDGDHIRFAANLHTLRLTGIKVSSQLLGLARLVDASKADLEYFFGSVDPTAQPLDNSWIFQLQSEPLNAPPQPAQGG